MSTYENRCNCLRGRSHTQENNGAMISLTRNGKKDANTNIIVPICNKLNNVVIW